MDTHDEIARTHEVVSQVVEEMRWCGERMYFSGRRDNVYRVAGSNAAVLMLSSHRICLLERVIISE
jgi:hypothetical protein